jgi:ElaB/YqjD/DUF883 family membrane-anchored ribosome-binding protein
MTNTSVNVADSAHASTDMAAKAAHDAIDRVARRAEQAEQRIRKTADSAEVKLRQSLQSAREKGLTVKGSVGQFVHDHPIACVGIAFGVGLLLSSLAKRSARTDSVGTQEFH